MRTLLIAALAATLPLVSTVAVGQATKAPAKAAPAATVPAWAVNPAASSIGFSGTHAGNRFAGKFSQWTADIRFDPAKLAASKAIVTVQTGSAATGNRTYDGTMPGAEWLNSKAFPTARFETTAIRSLGGNRYEADGRLTLKGATVPVKLPFTLTINGNTATMKGTASVDRLALNIGKESDPTADWVSRAITVDVAVTATRR